ncbi:deoxyribonuclease gamma-like [Protopterus annectens]|uniref:deoxyribonuclease gamma-like n=1 Tax=Protopterus annectens TaxID=7888 RepID=UPI001CFADB4E|nr:deoxyribonuclease gamma-like [Protopterus annectens]
MNITLNAAMKLVILLFFVDAAATGLKICAFNVKSFGEAKAANQKIMDTLLKILSRCDISLLQEVRDAKGTAVQMLKNQLNSYDSTHTYKIIESARLGRNNYQEQYVFFYRSGTVYVKDSYQYPDDQKEDPDAFSREPFVVKFEAPKTVIQDFVLIPQHTTPANATKELDELYDVFLDIRRRWKTEKIMFLGDFNADCGYVPKKAWKNIRICSEQGFHWLIGEKNDTTVKESTRCAYDRIVVYGNEFLSNIVPGSAKPFNFPEALRMSEAEALEVSDHYPVEVELHAKSGGQNNQALMLLVFTYTLMEARNWFESI